MLVSEKFNKEINENREALQLQKTAIIKDFKAQIKMWRKDLGEERREKICIEKKLDNLKKKTEEKRVKTETKSSQSVDVEDRPVPALTEPSVPNETAGEIVECSICAEVLHVMDVKVQM